MVLSSRLKDTILERLPKRLAQRGWQGIPNNGPWEEAALEVVTRNRDMSN